MSLQRIKQSFSLFDYDVSKNSTGEEYTSLNLYASETQQGLQESVYDEACQKYGLEVVYISRQFVEVDGVIGEDRHSLFSGDHSFKCKLYPLSFTNYNPTTVFAKSQPIIYDRAKFHIVKRRFLEDAERGTGIRDLDPQIGDIFKIVMTGDIFTVNFNEPEAQYYDRGKAFVWEFDCERETVTGDNYDTGDKEIDMLHDVDNISFAVDPRAITGDNLRIEEEQNELTDNPIVDPDELDIYGGL